MDGIGLNHHQKEDKEKDKEKMRKKERKRNDLVVREVCLYYFTSEIVMIGICVYEMMIFGLIFFISF